MVFLRTTGVPAPVFWDADFSNVYYGLRDTLWRATWSHAPRISSLASFPGVARLCNFWISDGLHAETCADESITVRGQQYGASRCEVWHLDSRQGRWDSERVRVSECSYGGCSCATGLAELGVDRFDLSTLLDSMTVDHHVLRDFQRGGASPEDEWRGRVTLACGSNRELIVHGSTGDSDHAQEPLELVERPQGTRTTIYERGAGLDLVGGQIAFQEAACLLLVEAEFSGAHARLIDERSARIVHRFPEQSFAAVWVPILK
jgi:hypothetical protein